MSTFPLPRVRDAIILRQKYAGKVTPSRPDVEAWLFDKFDNRGVALLADTEIRVYEDVTPEALAHPNYRYPHLARVFAQYEVYGVDDATDE